MNQFAPKSEFLKRRALSLHRSGISCREIQRMLHIAGTDTVRQWVLADRKVRLIDKAIDRAEKITALRDFGSALPTLAFVPHLEPSKNARYVMGSA